MAKILLSLHQFFPDFYTGTETLTLEYAHELKKRGHTPVILAADPLTCSPVPQLHRQAYEGFPVWRIVAPAPRSPLEHLKRESYEAGLRNLYCRIIAEEHPDIVHIFHPMRLTVSFAEIVKEKKIPLFFTLTDFWILCPFYQLIRHNGSLCTGPEASRCYSCILNEYTAGIKQPPLRFRLAKQFPKAASAANKHVAESCRILSRRIFRHKKMMQSFDGVFWSNPFMKDIFRKNGFEVRREKIIPFPVPEKAKDAFHLPPPSADGPLRVSFIGTLRSSKGPQVLLKAMQCIPKNVNIRLHVWGNPLDPHFMEKLGNYADGDRRISFKGVFPQEKFSAVLSEADVIVIPSLWYENTPLTAITALAARRILILSDLGGMSCLVKNGHNGFLFAPGNFRQLAEILEKLAKEKHLPGKLVSNIQLPGRVKEYADAVLPFYSE